MLVPYKTGSGGRMSTYSLVIVILALPQQTHIYTPCLSRYGNFKCKPAFQYNPIKAISLTFPDIYKLELTLCACSSNKTTFSL